MKGENSMQNLYVYDIEAEDINKVADENDVSVAEVVEALMEAVKDNDIDLTEYL